MVRGDAWLTTDRIDEPIHLLEGEMAIMNARSGLSLRSGTDCGVLTEMAQPSNGVIARLDGADPESADAFIGRRIDLDAAGRELLLNALPPVAHIYRAMPAAMRIRDHNDQLFDEITEQRPGSEFAVREYSQLLILDALRTFVDGLEEPAGWLKLLGDERVRPAFDLIHRHPEAAWGLDDLARAVAMSRTSFAVRFREVAGMPPRHISFGGGAPAGRLAAMMVV